MKRIYLFALSLPAFIGFFASVPWEKEKKLFHTATEMARFQAMGLKSIKAEESLEFIPIDSSILFPNARLCGGCHGYDPTKRAMVTTSGVDVNIYDDWRSSMMANSARDPFWRAKVSHEILLNPGHSEALQDKCTSCHAPSGHYQAKLKEHKPYYLMADLYNDTLGLDGVNCQMCHAQAPDKIGFLHSGQLNFDTNHIRVAYGPYEFVFAPPMHEFVGVTPMFADHIADAGLCAGCHTLLTSSVDLDGNLTGSTFVEQATYHEWLNSRYDKDHDNISCQSCHIPQIQDEIIISGNYQFLTPKYPYGVHELAGANVTMLKLMKENRSVLGIPAQAEHFDSTIAATYRMLQQKSVDMTLEAADLNGDTLQFRVALHNKAGHKFPSGYPSRRAWIEFELRDSTGTLLFHSGGMNTDFSIVHEDQNYEPHHQIIRSESQVQIYELAPGDVQGQFTNGLERAHTALKDNRLTPEGFLSTDPAYDTTKVVGIGSDPDFNRTSAGNEGTGTDVVHFRIGLQGYDGPIQVKTRLWYQSLPPKWMSPLFAFSSPEIDLFKTMYDNADLAPVLIQEKSLENLWVSAVKTQNPLESAIRIYPGISADGSVFVESVHGAILGEIQIWNASGKLIWQGTGQHALSLPQEKGVYLISVKSSKGRLVRRVVRQ